MKYRVRIGERAKRDLTATVVWIAEESEGSARQWYVAIREAIRSLADFPERCPVAPESGMTPREIRHLLHGKGRNVYRILFTIQGKTVHVLTIRHGAQNLAKPGDLALS